MLSKVPICMSGMCPPVKTPSSVMADRRKLNERSEQPQQRNANSRHAKRTAERKL